MEEGKERLLTFNEWQQERDRRECATFGHDWTFINVGNEPVSVYCNRDCGHPGYQLTLREKK